MSWLQAGILSAVQLVADTALSVGLPSIIGVAGYGVLGALISYGMARGQGGLAWAQTNARWNGIYTMLVPITWVLRGKATYNGVQWTGFVLVAVGSYLVG